MELPAYEEMNAQEYVERFPKGEGSMQKLVYLGLFAASLWASAGLYAQGDPDEKVQVHQLLQKMPSSRRTIASTPSCRMSAPNFLA
jgi:hypothetical protein